MSNFRSQKLWKENETALNYASPMLSFAREQRFKLYSIYWPEKNKTIMNLKNRKTDIDTIAFKISKLIDEEQKNTYRIGQDRPKSMRNFHYRRNFFFGKRSKNHFCALKISTKSKISKQNENVVNRLNPKMQIKQSLLRDRFGNRSNLLENQEEGFEKLRDRHNIITKSKGFKSSNRINFQLPNNFYPGPGTYRIERFLEEGKRAQSARPAQ